ncbi:MAG TPA: dienelactone hydrolase family protein [Candidatus Acidoferrum sp.]|nr:dienelactone hydrolase family protein [Candidatus Acidoferrum sp.]
MPSTLLTYQDGVHTLEAYVALPTTEARKRPAVLVSHAWAGRSAFECEKADKLAALGYVGIAIDNYGKGILGKDNAENSRLMTPFIQDRALLRQRLLAAITAARSLDMVDTSRMAAIGFCFGGLCALDMARSGADLRGVVSFHGLFAPAANLPNANITAKVLALHGHDDPMVPPEAVLALEKELTAAGADWQIHAFGNTMHAFTNPAANAPQNGMAYNPVVASRAWQSMQNFLTEIFA